jgi:hypothetical protein
MIEFYKDNEAMAIRTDAATDTEFLDGCAKLIGEMIAKNGPDGDWEFSLSFWLPQIMDIACSLRGYKAEVVTRTVRSAGSSHFIAATPTAYLNDRKEVTISETEKPAAEMAKAAVKAGK